MIPENDTSREIERLPRRKRDLSDIAGTWLEDPVFDSALEEQDTVWPSDKAAKSGTTAEKANS